MTAQDAKLEPGHIRAPVAHPRLATLTAVLALVIVSACRPTEPRDQTAATHPAGGAADEEIWEAYYLQGSKIGYGHTTVHPTHRADRELRQTRSLNHLEITRFGQLTEQDVKMELLETPAGEVVEFKTEVALGPAPTVVTGRVEGEQMTITTRTQGRRDTARIDWSSDVRGFRGVEQSLARKPMKPGETRSLRMLMPLVNQIANVELAAGDYEDTPVLGVEVKLLRVNSVARLPDGQSINSIAWVDNAGRVIKTRVAALQQESFRTTRQLAMAPGGEEHVFDLGLDVIVGVDPPLTRPHETREVRYRVELADGDPAKVFATGPTQSVRRLDDHAAEVTVRSLRPGEMKSPEMPPGDVPDEYRSANSVLQVDDPRIVEMAHEAKAGAQSPQDVAIALERYVNRVVGEKNFSHGFATAAEVAETRAGDCTEHAVLLAALARACGLPSRVAIGLVYLDRARGFGYHMWTEVFLDGQWVPLDAIMGQGGTSAAYLKLTDSSLDGASAYSSFLAVANVLGQLKVSVLEAK